MKAKFNVGFNWDPKLIPFFEKMNKEHDDTVIDYVYGSIQTVFGHSARPKSRVPHMKMDEFEDICHTLHDIGIKINYTLNSSCLGKLESVVEFKNLYLDELNQIAEHVDMMTVAHPLNLEFLEDNDIDVDIEISTILNVTSIAQFTWYSKIHRLKKICLAIERNRDIGFLQFLGLCNDKIPIPELIVNEFCNVAGANCEGIYRQSCYQCHSHDVSNIDDTNKYPMERCTTSRREYPESWLKARFILPQWIDKYQEIGINNFKITGRTHPTEYIKMITKAYMDKYWGGNLLELWAQLQTIWKGYSAQEASAAVHPYDKITCDKGRFNQLIDRHFRDPKFRCSEACTATCNYCGNLYESMCREVEKNES